MHIKPNWIAVDWGTTNLRAYALDEAGNILDKRHSNQGMNSLAQNEFEPTLLSLIEDWLSSTQTIPVYACGMVGAKQGWVEAAYRSIPCSPLCQSNLTTVKTQDSRISVKILPGLSQTTPPDVMRGEETQIAGFLTQNPEYQGAICLPGTHSKWISVSKNQVHTFQTFMTGELFSLLSQYSILRHSIDTQEIEDDILYQTALETIQQPNYMPQSLFSIRAASLLKRESASITRARLSGLIIGQEIGAAKDYWNTHPVALIGENTLARHYAYILKALSIKVQLFNVEDMTLKGLQYIASATK